MSSLFIWDASGDKDDKNSRKQIKRICKLGSIPCSETLDNKQTVLPREAKIIIAHLGFITGRDSDMIETKLQEIKSFNAEALIIGVSSSPDFIKRGWGNGFPSFYYSFAVQLLMRAIGESKCSKKDLKVCFEEIIKNSKIIEDLLHVFLPLDIDMQSLANKEINKKEYLQEMSNNLEELYKLNNYNCKNIAYHYRQKLFNLWYILKCKIKDEELLAEIEKHASSESKKLTPIDNPSKELLEIAGINNNAPKASRVYKFFEFLDNARKMGGKDLTKTIKNLFDPFGIQITGEKKKITTFHDWYCALAKYLGVVEF